MISEVIKTYCNCSYSCCVAEKVRNYKPTPTRSYHRHVGFGSQSLGGRQSFSIFLSISYLHNPLILSFPYLLFLSSSPSLLSPSVFHYSFPSLFLISHSPPSLLSVYLLLFFPLFLFLSLLLIFLPFPSPPLSSQCPDQSCVFTQKTAKHSR